MSNYLFYKLLPQTWWKSDVSWILMVKNKFCHFFGGGGVTTLTYVYENSWCLFWFSVIGIQEHMNVHNDNSQLQYENLPEGFQLVTASASRNSVEAASYRWNGSTTWPICQEGSVVNQVYFIKNTASYIQWKP